MEIQSAFQIHYNDNVATALTEIEQGYVELYGDSESRGVNAEVHIPKGHKIALKDIKEGEKIIKYGVVIGIATKQIAKGNWVHLHVMKSLYDTRSSHLDVITGAPKDVTYI